MSSKPDGLYSRRAAMALVAAGAAAVPEAAGAAVHALAPVGATPYGFVVAAVDAPADLKAATPYVCTGANDQNVINAAIAALPAATGAGRGGCIFLSAGTFGITAPIKLRGYMAIEGAMIGVTYIGNRPTASGDMMVFDAAANEQQIFLRIARMHLAGNRKWVRRGSCIRITGAGIYDLVIEDVWVYGAAEDGVYLEQTWGANFCNLISEYNGRDGLHVERNAFDSAVEGPKIVQSKMVKNGRHGIFLGRYVNDALIATSEMAGGAYYAGYGLYVDRSTGHQVTACRFVSHETGCSGGVALDAASQCTVTGNVFRSLATARCPVAVDILSSSSRNVVASNTFNLATGDTPIIDATGRNVLASNSGWASRTAGLVVRAHDAGDRRRITIAHRLGQPKPVGSVVVCTVQPADAASSELRWYVDAADATSVVVRTTSDMADGVEYRLQVIIEYSNREAAPA